MIETTYLLNDEQIRGFIVNGFVHVKAELPKSLHDGIHQKTEEIFGDPTEPNRDRRYNPLNNILPLVPELQEVLESPEVRGALTSILGNGYVMHTHRHCHPNFAGMKPSEKGAGEERLMMPLHKDGHAGGKRPRHRTPRWAILFYYPQACPMEHGPTCIIPGTQYLRHSSIDNDYRRNVPHVPGENGYRKLPENFVNRTIVPMSGELGTVWIMHFDLYHSYLENYLNASRYGMKFVFMGTEEPNAPSWTNEATMWQPPTVNMAAADHEILWTYMWNWMCGKGDRFETDHATLGNLDQWLKGLKDDDCGVRAKAANELGFMRQSASAAVPALIDALKDSHEPIRRNAAYALAAIGESAINPLAATLDDGKDAYEQEPILHISDAAHALAAIGESAVPTLAKALKDEREHIRAQAAYALGEMGHRGTAGVDALKTVLDDPSTFVRRHAISALGMIKHPPEKTVPALIDVLENSDDRELGFFAAQALTRIGPDAQDAVPALSVALRTGTAYIRGFSAEALSRIGTPEALQALVSFVRSARWFNYESRKVELFDVNLKEQPVSLNEPEVGFADLLAEWAKTRGVPSPQITSVSEETDQNYTISLDHGGKIYAELKADTLRFYHRRRVEQGFTAYR